MECGIPYERRAAEASIFAREGIMGASRIDLPSSCARCARRTLLRYALPFIAPQAVRAAQSGGTGVARRHTWLLASANELRPFPPAAPTRAVEAKNSRLWAGFHCPIDNDVGLAHGRQIGRLVLERETMTL